MLPVSANGSPASTDGVLREVVETLAGLDRTPCSPGERQAAEWLAARLRSIPATEVALEQEPSWGTFPPTATGLGLLGMAGAALVLGGRRAAGALLAAASFAGVVDEAQNGPRIVRRLVRRRRTTVNVIARVGEGSETLVLLATTMLRRQGSCSTRRSSAGCTSSPRSCSRGARPPRRSGGSDWPGRC